MADISDVETAMVQLIAGFLGSPSPYIPGSVIASSARAEVRIARGWPTTGALNADLNANITNVTVFPIPGMVRNATRYFFKWRQGSAQPTLTAQASGNTVTWAGAASASHVTGVAIGAPGTQRAAYAYRLNASDTPGSIASALAALIPGASAAGPVLTISTTLDLEARVAIDQPAWLETRRQEQAIWVMTWCSNAGQRDAVASTIDAGFAGMQDQWGRQTEFFGLPDGSDARLKYAGSFTDDTPAQDNLFRRNLKFTAEYPTTLLQQQPEVLFIGGPLWGDDVVLSTFGDTEPSTAALATPDGNSVFIDAAGNIIGAQPT